VDMRIHSRSPHANILIYVGGWGMRRSLTGLEIATDFTLLSRWMSGTEDSRAMNNQWSTVFSGWYTGEGDTED